jgi:hypothetical protein
VPQLRIPAWVPQSAKQAIVDSAAWPDPAPEMLAALERLATRDEMRDLWAKLPRRLPPGGIISLVLIAFSKATALEPPRPKDNAALIEHIRRYWKPDYLMIAGLARQLREYLDGVATSTRQRWQDHSGEGFERTLARVQEMGSFFEALDSKSRDLDAILSIPEPPRKRGGETASQVWFSSILSSWFLKLYGRPLDAVVAILETVTFNLPAGEVTDETIRGRRRWQKPPEGFGRKRR